MESFHTAFKEMIIERTYEIGNKILIKNKERRDIEEKIYELYSEIEKLLPDDMKNLIFKHEELVNSNGALTEKIVYEQGLRDGVELIKILGLI
ncbi:MAG TPA: hypothetical protein GXZ27_13345 [Thermoanaerobacterales bacterium]|jgi:hypothetical protein|nr:hypothetical protein [Thermoanaerobacterales bacterium]